MTDFDAVEHLKSLQTQSENDVDMGLAALALMMPDHKGVSPDRYITHLKAIRDKVKYRHDELIKGGATDDGGAQLAALKYTISEIYEYKMDPLGHEKIESADFMRVIDRGSGGRVALALLYVDAARHQGWSAYILSFPTFALCRIDKGGERIIFDPACADKILAAHDLRCLIKDALGEGAELSTDYFSGLSACESVVLLGNEIKHRRIEMEEYVSALEIIERMRMAMPSEYRLLLDAGVLYARTGDLSRATDALNEYIECSPHQDERQEAMKLLTEMLDR